MPYDAINGGPEGDDEPNEGSEARGSKDSESSHYSSEDSESNYSDAPEYKRARTNGAEKGTTSKRPPSKPRLPEAGAFNPEYDIQTHGVPTQTNKRKDLNIQREYGSRSFWPVEAGLRELLQNTWDGCVAFMRFKRRDATAEDIEVCFLVDGVAVSRTDPRWTVKGSLGDLESDVVFTFLFRVKKTLPRPPKLPRPRATASQRDNAPQEKKRPRPRRSRFDRRGDCGVWSDERLLGWVSLQRGKEQCVDIELFNLHLPLTLATMTFGSSTKANEVETIGEWGDGMKMGINCLKSRRPSHGTCAVDVHYVTGNVQWDFAYNDEKSLEARETRSDIPFVPGVLVRILNFPQQRIDLRKFLFLSPPKRSLATKLGSIIFDKSRSHKIYVKGIQVDTLDSLVYGVDIRTNISLSRDRVGLQSETMTARVVCRIWAELLLSDTKAKDLYLDLLLAKDASLEVRRAPQILEKEHVKALWKHLRKREEKILHKRPYPLEDVFWDLLNEHCRIQTPTEARAEKFRGLPPSPISDQSSTQVKFTLHLLEALICLTRNSLSTYYTYEFKAAPPNMDVEVVVVNTVVLLNDCTLSSAHIHKNHPHCPYYQRYLHSMAEIDQRAIRPIPKDRFPNIGPTFICHCAAFHILSLIEKEVPRALGNAEHGNIRDAHQTALQTLPRDLVFRPVKDATSESDIVEMSLSWRTWSGVSEFLVTITSDVESKSRLLVYNSEKDNPQTKTGAPSTAPTFSRTFECKANTLCLTDSVPRGQRYVAQVCWNKPRSLYSLPYHFAIPPSPPRSSSLAVVQHLPDQLLITWTANAESDGADSWIVVVRHGEKELLRKEAATSTLDTRVEGLPTDIASTNVVVEVYGKSTKLDGLASTDCASWPCRKEKPPPPEVDEEMAYIAHEPSVHGANDLGDTVHNDNDREQTIENITKLVIPTYDELVAKSSILSSGDKTYINVNVRWVTVQGIKKKLTAGKSFVVNLQGADGRLLEHTIIYIHSIRVPDDPGPDDEDIVDVRQYIPRDRIQPDAPPNELLRICQPQRDPSHFRLSDIVDVHSEAIPISDLDVLADAAGVGEDRFCKWNIVFCDDEEPRFTPVLTCRHTPPALPTLEFGELLSGTGSASLGFRGAGFNHRFVVEPDVTLGSAFSMNSRTPVFKESIESFLSRSWSAQPMLHYPFAALLVNCDTRTGRATPKDILTRCIEEFRPAYAVCTFSPDTNSRKIYDMVYKAMNLGYCLKWQVLDCADFGVAAHKEYLVVFACAPGREMPDFPRPRTSVPRTLKDAILDLEWDNATCRPSGKGFATDYPHLAVDQRQALSWHCTGCYLPDVTSWDPDATVAKWEEPLPDTFLLPSETVKCRHPHHPERFLSVREMARILGISDEWEFTGSLREQYIQLASAMPPLLSQAIAEELRKVLVVDAPLLVRG